MKSKIKLFLMVIVAFVSFVSLSYAASVTIVNETQDDITQFNIFLDNGAALPYISNGAKGNTPTGATIPAGKSLTFDATNAPATRQYFSELNMTFLKYDPDTNKLGNYRLDIVGKDQYNGIFGVDNVNQPVTSAFYPGNNSDVTYYIIGHPMKYFTSNNVPNGEMTVDGSQILIGLAINSGDNYSKYNALAPKSGVIKFVGPAL